MPAEGLVVNGPGGHDARGNVRLHQFFRQKGHPQARVHGLYDGVGADRFPGGLYVEIVQGENVVQKGVRPALPGSRSRKLQSCKSMRFRVSLARMGCPGGQMSTR